MNEQLKQSVISRLRSQPHLLAKRRIERVCRGRVLSGPFAGLFYTGRGFMSSATPKVVGTYELELFPAFERLVKARPELFINAGAAEGFYASALASRLPQALVLAYEIEEKNHQAIRHLARKNQVCERVEIRGACDTEALSALGRSHPCNAAMLMDVEGAEFDILTQQTAPLLAEWQIIVEVHPWANPEARDILRSTFEQTHDIEVIPVRERKTNDIPAPLRSFWLNRWILRELREFRPPGMFWLEMIPKQR